MRIGIKMSRGKKRLPTYILKNNILYLEGTSYYISSSDTTTANGSDNNSTTSILSGIAGRHIMSIFRNLMDNNRDDAIEYVLESPRRMKVIKETCEIFDAYCLLGSLLSRRHEHGLKAFFNITLRQPEEYSETFGTEIVSYCSHLKEGEGNGGITVTKIYGQGSFGFVYRQKDGQMIKFTYFTDAFIVELLSAFFLVYSRNSLMNDGVLRVSPGTIHLHEQKIKQLYPCLFPEKIIEKYGSLTNIIKSLVMDIAIMTESSYMHTDITPNNVMWDIQEEKLKIIDFGGTMGDDSFYDLGERVTRLCTKTTRPEEYSSRDLLSLRDERSELFSAFYTACEIVLPAEQRDKRKTRFLLPKEKCDLFRSFARISGVIDPYFDMSNEEQTERPLLETLITLTGACKNTPYIETMKSSLVKMFPRVSHSTIRRISKHFSLWRIAFAFVHLPTKEVRTLFIGNLLAIIVKSHNCEELLSRDGRIPIYILFRCIHLFDALYASVSLLPIRLIVLSLLYICLSLAKFPVVSITHIPQHPVYCVLREFFSISEITSLLFTPLTAYLLLAIDNSCCYSIPWFKCLYSLNREKRFFSGMEEGIEKEAKEFARFYFRELLKSPIVEPVDLFSKYDRNNNEESEGGEQMMVLFNRLLDLWF